jgi:hypothetical protein
MSALLRDSFLIIDNIHSVRPPFLATTPLPSFYDPGVTPAILQAEIAFWVNWSK